MKHAIILFIILSIAFSIRVIWVDEIPAKFDADIKRDMGKLIEDTFDNGLSPFHYFAHARGWGTRDEPWFMCLNGLAYQRWGIGLLTTRMVGALIGVLTVFLWIILFTDMYGRGWGYVAGTLLAVFPVHVAFSRYGHSFHIPCVFMITALICTCRYFDTRKKIYTIGAGFSTGWIYSLHLSALSIFPVVVGLIATESLFHEKNKRVLIKAIILFLIGFIISSSPFWYYFNDHSFQHTVNKSALNTHNKPEQETPTDRLKRNLTVYTRFFYNKGDPGYFFYGGDQYFPGAYNTRFFSTIVFIFLCCIGLGYCLARYKDVRSWVFVLMLLFIPVPALASATLSRRLVMMALPLTGLCTIGLYALYRSVPLKLHTAFKIFIVMFLFLFTISSIDTVLQPGQNKHRAFSMQFAKEFRELLEMDAHIFCIMGVGFRDAMMVFNDQWIIDHGKARADCYTATNWNRVDKDIAEALKAENTVIIYAQIIHAEQNKKRMEELCQRLPGAVMVKREYYWYAVVE